MQTTQSQPIEFLITIYSGILVGIIYEVYHALRKSAKKRKWLAYIYDSMFIAIMGAIVALALYFANQGELRLYTIVGFALGFALYLSGLSPLVRYLFRKKKIKSHEERKIDR